MSESDAPMVIGALVLEVALLLALLVLLVVLLVPELLHAARMLTDSTAAPRAKAFLGIQGS
ncbi:MAG TPA: hypothetical protein VIY52_05655 [Streptosporangiaceae bacterium]